MEEVNAKSIVEPQKQKGTKVIRNLREGWSVSTQFCFAPN